MALMVSVMEKKPAAMLPTVNSEGSRNMPRRSRACALALGQRRVIAAVHSLLHSPGMAASTLAPPLTRWPTFTAQFGLGRQQHVHAEPNLISPRAGRAPPCRPLWKLKTMRRASRPAICLKVTSMPSPRTVTPRSARCGPPRPGSWRSDTGPSDSARGENAADRRAVHVHIEDAEEDADPLPGPFGGVDGTVSVTSPSPGETINPRRRESSAGDRGRTREKTPPAAPARCPRPVARSPRQHRRHRQQAQTVDVTVTNHRPNDYTVIPLEPTAIRSPHRRPNPRRWGAHPAQRRPRSLRPGARPIRLLEPNLLQKA
jgi:hypothetical protein